MISLFKKSYSLDRKLVTFAFSLSKENAKTLVLDEILSSMTAFFTPTFFFKSGEFIEFNIEAFKKELIGDIYDQDKIQRVSLVYPIHKSKPFSIVIEVLSKNLLVIEGAVGVIINLEGFFAGYAFNSEDTFLQNTNNLAFYKSKGIDTDELKTIRNRYGDLRIDISENPGRRVFIENMWLMSCWRMWFGEMSFKYLDKSKLSTFPKAKEIRFKGNVIFIALYENHFDANKSKNRKIQQSFREWTGMNEVEKKYQ